MTGADTKNGRNSDIPKPRFGGGRTLKFGGGFRTDAKVKSRTTNLEDVVFQVNLLSSKMLNQYREGMDVLATHVGKDFGGAVGPMAAQAIRKRKEPVGAEPAEPIGPLAAPGSIGMLKWAEEWKVYYKKKEA